MLNTSLEFHNRSISNRIVFQPMEGCDCNTDGSPGELTVAKYLRAARSGAGIIWMEANAVCPEGRTSERQMMLTRENLPAFRQLVAQIRAEAKKEGFSPLLFLQLTHSGRQSIRPMIAYRHPIYEQTRPIASDDAIVTDEYLDTLAKLYANSASLALEAGFDGVDVKSCHGYLFQELLSAFDRPGRYGGSFENRTRLYFDCVRAVMARVGDKIEVVTRLGVSDMVPYPYGFGTTDKNELDLSEAKKLIALLEKEGIRMINITIGNPYYNPHINRPFRLAHYTAPESPETGLARFETVESELKRDFPNVTWVGSGLSFYRNDLMEQADRQIREGVCDLVGFGRVTLAYPEFFTDYLKGNFDGKKTCVACSKCTALMRAKCVSGCAVYNPYYRELYKEKVLCKKQHS